MVTELQQVFILEIRLHLKWEGSNKDAKNVQTCKAAIDVSVLIPVT